MKLGYVDEEELLEYVADALNLLRVDLKWRAIPRELLDLMPEGKAREYHVIPVDPGTIRSSADDPDKFNKLLLLLLAKGLISRSEYDLLR